MVGPPLWKIWTSIGMISNPIYGKIIQMFQTTNQIWKSWGFLRIFSIFHDFSAGFLATTGSGTWPSTLGSGQTIGGPAKSSKSSKSQSPGEARSISRIGGLKWNVLFMCQTGYISSLGHSIYIRHIYIYIYNMIIYIYIYIYDYIYIWLYMYLCMSISISE